MSAPWLRLSRWRALPNGDAWGVVSEDGRVGVESMPTHREAQEAADRMNADEAAVLRLVLGSW